MNSLSPKILSSALLTGTVLMALLGGLALVVRSLRNIDLRLSLELRKDDKAERKY